MSNASFTKMLTEQQARYSIRLKRSPWPYLCCIKCEGKGCEEVTARKEEGGTESCQCGVVQEIVDKSLVLWTTQVWSPEVPSEHQKVRTVYVVRMFLSKLLGFHVRVFWFCNSSKRHAQWMNISCNSILRLDCHSRHLKVRFFSHFTTACSVALRVAADDTNIGLSVLTGRCQSVHAQPQCANRDAAASSALVRLCMVQVGMKGHTLQVPEIMWFISISLHQEGSPREIRFFCWTKQVMLKLMSLGKNRDTRILSIKLGLWSLNQRKAVHQQNSPWQVPPIVHLSKFDHQTSRKTLLHLASSWKTHHLWSDRRRSCPYKWWLLRKKRLFQF